MLDFLKCFDSWSICRRRRRGASSHYICETMSPRADKVKPDQQGDPATRLSMHRLDRPRVLPCVYMRRIVHLLTGARCSPAYIVKRPIAETAAHYRLQGIATGSAINIVRLIRVQRRQLCALTALFLLRAAICQPTRGISWKGMADYGWFGWSFRPSIIRYDRRYL